MDPNCEQALAEKAKNGMAPGSTNYSEDNH